ncbi:hypothetical protein FWP32_20885 [Vibrio alginolyticus]|nr:hypothetical protein [Vibrio alginolyticus]QCO88348.1 hypothetical protein D3H41_20285 [Vibrio neocaledonicus]EGR0169605.1 hypothetical protein [Vibrio alginolyticus]EHA1075204.1 hypothetical protein [Vibrio alginolyticus]EHA1133613.1 hypothetical protein [Vibrio alginolyticus]
MSHWRFLFVFGVPCRNKLTHNGLVFCLKVLNMKSAKCLYVIETKEATQCTLFASTQTKNQFTIETDTKRKVDYKSIG